VIGATQTASAQMAPVRNAAVQGPWYVEVDGGLLWRMDASHSTTFFSAGGGGLGAPLSGAGTDTVAFDPGYIVTLGIGYRLPLGFRLEIEGGYSHYTVASASPLSTDGTFSSLNGSRFNTQSGGGRDQYTGMFNAFYDVPMSGWWAPYIGVGGGVSYVQAETTVFADSNGVPRLTGLGGNSTDAVMMAEVGVTFTLDPKWSVVPSYRFQHVFTASGAFPNNDHIIKLGIRYSP
jgi:opacity protein-like surface antigen